MQGHRQSFIHLLYATIVVQFVIIAVLLGGFSMEYLSNDYYRGWIDANYPWLGFLLQGQLGALLIGIGLGGTFLLIMAVRNDRRVEREVGSKAGIHHDASYATDNSVSDQPVAQAVVRLRQDEPEDVMVELEREDA